GSFTITRNWKHAPQRVFAAFADQETKAKWFAGPPGWEQHEKSFDFREGGRETLVGRHPTGTVSSFDCIYRDILAPAAGEAGRIIYTYVMPLGGEQLCVSQGTIQRI